MSNDNLGDIYLQIMQIQEVTNHNTRENNLIMVLVM